MHSGQTFYNLPTYNSSVCLQKFISNFIQIPIWTEGSICFQSGMEVTCGKDRLIFLQQVLTRLKESTIDVKGTWIFVLPFFKFHNEASTYSKHRWFFCMYLCNVMYLVVIIRESTIVTLVLLLTYKVPIYRSKFLPCLWP